MFYLQCYAFFWMILAGYMAYLLVDQKKRMKQINDMIENGHVYEKLLAALPVKAFSGIFAAVQIILMAADGFGFLLAYSYIPLVRWQRWLFVLIVCFYIAESLNSFAHIKKIRRIFEGRRSFNLLARYMRYRTQRGSIAAYVSTYGKCLVSVNLFLHVC